MSESGITEDLCRCGHVASAHHDGEGECHVCKNDRRPAWTIAIRCKRFDWAMMWESERTA